LRRSWLTRDSANLLQKGVGDRILAKLAEEPDVELGAA